MSDECQTTSWSDISCLTFRYKGKYLAESGRWFNKVSNCQTDVRPFKCQTNVKPPVGLTFPVWHLDTRENIWQNPEDFQQSFKLSDWCQTIQMSDQCQTTSWSDISSLTFRYKGKYLAESRRFSSKFEIVRLMSDHSYVRQMSNPQLVWHFLPDI